MNEKKRFFKNLFLVFVSFSLIVSFAGCIGTGKGDDLESAYSISGVVTGAAVEGVTINLSGAAAASTTTDASGNYSFFSLTNGTYTVTPAMAGYTFNPLSTVNVVSGANVTGTNFVAAAILYIYVPGAAFIPGSPPPASGNSAALVATNAAPSGPLYTNSPITWTVTWTVTTVPVTYVDLYIPEMGGYFEYEVEPEEAAAGEAQFDMVQSYSMPSGETCTSPFQRNPNVWYSYIPPCYVEAPVSTTESLQSSVSLIGNEVDVGGIVYVGGAGLSWGGCGDGYCMDGENSFACPGDCPVVCGNLTCENGENSSTCPGDCRTAVCGNLTCESGENPSNCPSDCQATLTVSGDIPSGSSPSGAPGQSELPAGFPTDVPYGNYTQVCVGSGVAAGMNSTSSLSNTDINQFSQEIVGNTQTLFQSITSSYSIPGCTWDNGSNATPWNGTYFTMTFNFSLSCSGIPTITSGMTCTITADN